MTARLAVPAALFLSWIVLAPRADGAELLAGVGKADITERRVPLVNDPLFVKALVLKREARTAAILTVDAVSIGGIGYIKDDYLGKVRGRLKAELGIEPADVIVNASHCHGIVRADVAELTVEAVRKAASALVPVNVGAGVGFENGVQENRRFKLKNGRQSDVRHAYSLPPDDAVAEIGPIDPEIGVLRLDRKNGSTLAVLYNFAVHPIQGVPNGGNTADLVGYASKAIEENLSEGALALFVQGCAGDVNPVRYKAVDHPRSAEPLGNRLGLSVLRAVRKIRPRADDRLVVRSRVLALPRADTADRIKKLEAERAALVDSLGGTSLDVKTFLPLVVKYGLDPVHPSYHVHEYLREKAVGVDDLARLDDENRRNMAAYLANVRTMEEITRINTNLKLLKMHQGRRAEGQKTLDVEITAWRIGDFVLTTFPGELTVRIGLGIKKRAPDDLTFVAGYTNGYIYYAPTEDQLGNSGCAQEDCDCLVAPGWQTIYETAAAELLKGL